jgi:hypothetical protein
MVTGKIGVTMAIHCPACASENNRFSSRYKSKNPSFLSVKDLRECRECHLVFAHPMPLDGELEEYYSSQYPGIFHSASDDVVPFSVALAQSRIGLLSRYMHMGDGVNILDVGAGNAEFGRVLKGMVPDATYDAVEPDSGSREKWGPWVSNAYADLNEVKQDAYSGVILNEVLEHVNQPVPFLEEIHGCMQSRGYLFIDVPNRDDLYKPTVEPHILFWEKRSLEKALGDTGFEILFCDSAGLSWKEASRFYDRTSLSRKIRNRWFWISLMNRLLRRMGTRKRIDFAERLELGHYGEKRQWLRCIGRKI